MTLAITTHPMPSRRSPLVLALLQLLAVGSGLNVPTTLRMARVGSPAQLTMRAAGEPPAWRKAAAAVFAVCAGVLAPIEAPGGIQAGGDGNSFIARLVGARPAAAAPAPGIVSGATAKRLKLALKAKLAKVPVFLVTNEGGSPFLSTISGGDQSALMFLFPSDAQRMLGGVMKAPNAASSGAKVASAVGLLGSVCWLWGGPGALPRGPGGEPAPPTHTSTHSTH